VLLFCFFFSSRRRHTRFSRDWSSDVCSSDLEAQAHLAPLKVQGGLGARLGARPAQIGGRASRNEGGGGAGIGLPGRVRRGQAVRSEERRVGKEGRDRRSL